MSENNISPPMRIFLAMALWGIILWIFTLGHPAVVPVAKFIFMVLILPHGIAEWLKYKNIVREEQIMKVRIGLIVAFGVIWYLFYRI